MKNKLGIFIGGAAVGFATAQIAKTLIIGIVVLAGIVAAFWFAVSFGSWRDKLQNMFRLGK